MFECASFFGHENSDGHMLTFHKGGHAGERNPLFPFVAYHKLVCS